MQDWEIYQQIEHLIKVTYMEMEHEQQNEDVYLMQRTPQVTTQSPPPQAVEPTPSGEGDVVPLDVDPVMDVYNMSFNEFQKRIIKEWRNNFLDDHESPAFIREREIVTDTREHPNAISEANLAFVRATRSIIQYLMAKNDKLAQNLQATMKDA